jgi:hypothetical protein
MQQSPNGTSITGRAGFWIVRANALYIGIAGVAGLIFDIRGVLFGLGPQGLVLADAPHAAIGFVEAHGLAAILSVVLWRSAAARASHVAAFAMDALLGTSNLAFWPLFVFTDALMVGYVTTTLHLTFALLNLLAFLRAGGVNAHRADQVSTEVG